MPRKLDPAVKADREKAAADKKAARASAAKKRAHAKAQKHLDKLVKMQKKDIDKIVPGITAHQLTVYAGRVRAFSDRIQEAMEEVKKHA